MLDEKFKDFRGNVLKNDDGSDLSLTVRDSLLGLLGNDREADNGEVAIKSFRIGLKVAEAKDLSGLNTDEKAYLLNRVRKSQLYAALIKGYLISILE